MGKIEKQNSHKFEKQNSHKLEKQNVTPRKELRSFTGKCTSFATLIEAWRPFIQDLYGALHDESPSAAPTNCVWTAQFSHVLKWIRAFFEEELSIPS